MGTRGFLGFVTDGQQKITYNHNDSYPAGLGLDVLGWLRIASVDGAEHIAERARLLRVVRNGSEPTDVDIEQLRPFTNLNVGERSALDWYCLLRETQGNPAAILQAGVIEDGSEFPADSLFAEYGYIVDLDRGVFEAYEGFQREPHNLGRFASRRGSDDYFPVALVAEWKFSSLPSNDDFIAAFGGKA